MNQKTRNSNHLTKSLKQSLTAINLSNTSNTDNENESIMNYTNFVNIPNSSTGQSFTLIGNGTCSEVFLVRNIMNKQTYIKKVYDFSLFPKHKRNIEKELAYFKKFNHENIIKVYAENTLEDKQSVIFDYGSKGTLSSFITHKGRLSESNAFYYFNQLLNGLNYIHSNHYILRNLKPENIIITQSDKVLISDLSMCTQVKTKRISLYDLSEDIWSLGVILYLLTQGNTSSSSSNSNNQLKDKDLDNSNNNNNESNKKLEFPNPISTECKDLIQFLFNANSTMTLKDVFEQQWIKSHQNNPLHKLALGQLGDLNKDKSIRMPEEISQRQESNSNSTKILPKIDKGREIVTPNPSKKSFMKCLECSDYDDNGDDLLETNTSNGIDTRKSKTKANYYDDKYKDMDFRITETNYFFDTYDENNKEEDDENNAKNNSNKQKGGFWANLFTAFNCK